MTSKMILDSFSETLMQDERILSLRERELLSHLLQNSRGFSANSQEIQLAVAQTVARSVGETVAQRAFAVLGGSIVDRILANSPTLAPEENVIPEVAFGVPEPPSGPRPSVVPEPPSGPKPGAVPQPPSGPHPGSVPQPPSGVLASHTRIVPMQPEGRRAQTDSSVGVLEVPTNFREQCVVLEEFLAPQELDELTRFALEHETNFQNSEVISPSGVPGTIDYNHRRSRVLMDLGKHQEVVLQRIQSALPRVLDRLGMEEFPVTRAEAQITASNDGDFFGTHSDNGQDQIASRRLTFVYFFHREPRQFAGGELRLYDSAAESKSYSGSDHGLTYQTIVPQQNQIVLFPCSVMHEITPVECSSGKFADSRFTLNGWVHK